MNNYKTGVLERINSNKLLKSLFIFFSNNFLYLLRSVRLNRKKGKGILIVSLHLMGDTVYTIPAIRHLLRDNPGKKFHVLCFAPGRKLYSEFFPEIEIHAISKKDFIKNRIAGKKVREVVNRINAETIVDITGAITSVTSVLFASGKLTGMNLAEYKKVYTHFTPLRTEPHLMDMYLDAVSVLLKAPVDKKLYEFKPTPGIPGKLLIFPFAGWSAKEWGFEKFLEIAKFLKENYIVEFIAEPGQLTPERESKLAGNKIKVNYSGSLDELFRLIKDCSLFISNDSGPLRVAQALGKPVFIIYGPSNPDYSIPFPVSSDGIGDNAGYIRKFIHCSPTGTQFCHTLGGRRCPTIECMRELSVDNVYAKLSRFLLNLGTRT